MNTQILDRIAYLTKTDGAQTWQLLKTLQKEQAPWMDNSEIENAVIYSLVKLHNDYQLSWLWHQEQCANKETTIAA